MIITFENSTYKISEARETRMLLLWETIPLQHKIKTQLDIEENAGSSSLFVNISLRYRIT